jgi:hypothetical protein
MHGYGALGPRVGDDARPRLPLMQARSTCARAVASRTRKRHSRAASHQHDVVLLRVHRRLGAQPVLAAWKLPSQEVHAVCPSPRQVPAKVIGFVERPQGEMGDTWWSDTS